MVDAWWCLCVSYGCDLLEGGDSLLPAHYHTTPWRKVHIDTIESWAIDAVFDYTP